MLFSIYVSFTNKHVNHTVIFELKKLYEKKNNNNNNNYKLDELRVKLTSPVSSCNLDSGKSNVPGYTKETHGPLLTGTASSILISSSESVSVRTRFCGVDHLDQNDEFQIILSKSRLSGVQTHNVSGDRH